MLYYLISIILCSYACMILISIYGWRKSHVQIQDSKTKPFCSIIIAARNEEKTISRLLDNLKNQDYPQNLYEIIIANDHSTDNTETIIEEIAKEQSNIILYNVPNSVSGKKEAIQYILPFAKGDYIVFTDADCQVNPSWISSYISYIEKNQGDLFFGSVSHCNENSILQKCFTLDFLGIIGVQAGLALQNHAFSCNAANMCISSNFYKTAYNTNNEFSSGDDVFLLHKAKKKKKNNIHFVKDSRNTVYTNPPENINSFIKQRIRWSSKSSGYTDIDAILVSLIVYSTSFLLFTCAFFSLFTSYFYSTFLLVFICKTFFDIIYFKTILPFYNKSKLIWLVIPFEFFYFIYITIIPIFAILIPIKWKERKIK